MTTKMGLLLLALLLAAAVPAAGQQQVKLYVLQDPASGLEREVTGALFDVGSAGPGDTLLTRFRLRNTGTTTQQVQVLRIAGQGFTLSTPTLPYTLAPGGLPLDFSVRFSGTGVGSYSASLTAGTISVLLRATVTGAPVLVGESASGVRTDIAAGTTVAVGSVQRGQRLVRTLRLENRAGTRLTVRAISVSGTPAGVFAYRGPALPLEIADGGSQPFDIEFAPPASQQYSATLSIDGRNFPVTGTGLEPPLPAPVLSVDGKAQSGEQPKLSIRFPGPAGTVRTGVLRMEFRPAGTGVADDPAIRFVASGSRTLNVVTKADDEYVWISTAVRDAVFQTGTTAGEILWTLELGGHRVTQTMTIAPATAAIDQAAAVRRVQDLDVTIAGYDNTRTMSQAAFTFYDSSGRMLGAGAILADVRREFERFFAGSRDTGGVFTMRATFPVQGPAAQIGAVEVELTNSAGAARTQRIVFP